MFVTWNMTKKKLDHELYAMKRPPMPDFVHFSRFYSPISSYIVTTRAKVTTVNMNIVSPMRRKKRPTSAHSEKARKELVLRETGSSNPGPADTKNG